ncbi:Serine/threonine-protein phosphatase 1 regulatory subunit 10 [Frankliniella fusca]|uniref:Serine/threonine-protein phosphatase 1 regulatory subunit 10 n=1 Tax=Frankliniella fusca TaxID=407009 RepID=A0AAE1HCS5_9NEOP|nr:Serine/threonine-protein phosphatase 1 regulatory subunit 10 [Frankliniella fusca]
MPRIDPMQLLRCLSVLLGPSGGILSRDQVGRLASLMTKFSKKLVSKCIYVLILKNTKTELIGMFMSEGGWALTNSWLADAIEARNWPLMKELLELLLMCPVDVERLKANNCPKLVKGLSKDTTDRDVQVLATRLVAQWLQVVKYPGTVIPQPSVDVSHLNLEPHHGLEMGPQTTQLQTLQESREDSFFPSDIAMHSDISSDLFCDPSDINLDTISKEDLFPASDNLCEFRSDSSTLIGSGTDISNVVSEIPSELVANEIRNDVLSEMNCNTVLGSLSEVATETVPELEPNVMDTTEPGDIASAEPKGKLILKLTLKDGNKVSKSPTKRKLSEDDEEISPSKRKPRDVSKDKKKIEKEKSDKPSHKHEKSDKTDSRKSSSEKKSSSSKDLHKGESRHGDSKSKHHHSDKSKDRPRDKDKEKSKSSSSSSSSRDKEKERAKLKEKERLKQKEKEKAESQAEKDKATLAKVMQTPVSKLGKIPKKTDSSTKSDKVHPPVLSETKKISISIENRKKSGEPRPNTVKTAPTKFRSTGLEEVVKPPPSRKDVKKTAPSVGPVLPTVKDSSPLLSLPSLPEKRTKPVLNLAGPPDRPGAIKVIPAKPKASVIQESDFFMDALTAANAKREPRKRKRRTSGSKDDSKEEPTSPTGTTPGAGAAPAPAAGEDGSVTPTASPSSSPERPAVEAKPVFKFYQETLQLHDEGKKEEEEEDAEEADKDSEAKVKKENDERTQAKEEDSGDEAVAKEKKMKVEDGSTDDPATEEDSALMERERNRLPRGVLVFHRPIQRQRKSLKWKADTELESVHYFELDETERVNVTKTSFMDMKQMERVHERENFHLARRMSGEDQMKEHTIWSRLIPIDLAPSEVVPGFKSMEKEVQFAREKTTPASPVFQKNVGCPDSAAEPDPVPSFKPTDPVPIPLEDVTGPNSIYDYTSTPWPEPKPLLIPQSPPHSHTISHVPSVTPHPHPGPLLPSPIGGPVFNSMGGDWRTGDGKVVMADVGMGMAPGMGAMGPGMMGAMGPGLDGGVMGPVMGPGMGPGGPGMGPGMGPPGMVMGGMDMYNQNGMDGPWNSEMNYGMMGGGPGDMYPMDQGNFDMYPGQGFGGNQGGPGFNRGRGRGWYRGGSGDSWRGSGGGGGGRGRGSWSGPGGPPSKRICRYFKRGNCATNNCQFLHPPELKGVSSRH